MVFQRLVKNILAVAPHPEVFSIEFKPDWYNVRLAITGYCGNPSQTLRFQILSFSFRENRQAPPDPVSLRVTEYIDYP
jgi:hypothetical protein